MVLSRAEGIRSEELSTVELSMISAAKVPHFLPMHAKEVDLQVTLRYDITEKKMLSHMLKSERINMTEYYGLLLQVAETLEQSILYMLQPAKYALNEDYIFVDGSLQEGTLYLTYIPLEQTEGLTTLGVGLKELVTKCMASVTELSGGGVQQLLQYTTSEQFTLNGFKRLLHRLLSTESDYHTSLSPSDSASVHPRPEHTSANALRGAGNTRWNQPPHSLQAESGPGLHGAEAERVSSGAHEQLLNRGRRPDAAEEHFFPVDRKSRSQVNQEDDIVVPDFLKRWDAGVPGPEGETDAADREPKSASSRRTYIALGCLLVAALVWRMLYMSSPSSGKLILCVLLTLILAVIAFLSWTGRILESSSQAAAETSFDALPDFGSSDLSSGAKRSKGRLRFEVEPLTGFFRGTPKKGPQSHSEIDASDKEPDWKWKLPPAPVQAGAERSETGIGEGLNRVRSVMDGGLRGSQHGNADHEMTISSRNERLWNYAGVGAEAKESDPGERKEGFGQKTEWLDAGKAGATVLLSRSDTGNGMASSPAAPFYYLLREGEEGLGAERIDLRQQHFVIGRSEEVSQYVESSVGASRAHVELSRSEDGGYLIKDLGSKNGTRLKGEAMVPYKEYPLQDGDQFTIVKGAYTFRSA
ncbi:DUF6382 domain-containing protein [Paenibacillus sp. SAF-054]|uniref:DUF6382 domain-containing protein n=1 Tax=unclassified Paenibacillus TaxID=185978 RepID=UPI003F7E31F1